MVRIAFICEDDAGKKIIDSQNFLSLLNQNNLELIPPVFNAKGKGNLTELNIIGLLMTAIANGATHIFILTDLDMDSCITNTRKNLVNHQHCTIIVCKKAVEAWFLADNSALSGLLKRTSYFPFPEDPIKPFDEINNLHKNAFNGRGISKSTLPTKMIDKGFSVLNASKHQNCSSAQYFIRKLLLLKDDLHS